MHLWHKKFNLEALLKKKKITFLVVAMLAGQNSNVQSLPLCINNACFQALCSKSASFTILHHWWIKRGEVGFRPGTLCCSRMPQVFIHCSGWHFISDSQMKYGSCSAVGYPRLAQQQLKHLSSWCTGSKCLSLIYIKKFLVQV